MRSLIICFFILLGLLFPAFAHTASLNDTGQDTCYDGSTMVACSDANSGDAATYPRQDGRFGRDAAAAAGQLTKAGGGAKGFDYSKIANNGSVLSASATLGSGLTNWACTRDNVTGLIWEIKTATNTDLRYSGHSYTWYNSNPLTNGGSVGNTGSNTCNATLPGSLCNTEAYVTAVNAGSGLCSATDWRMPTRRELLSIMHNGAYDPPIDTAYFPGTLINYWSADGYFDPDKAWVVVFDGSGGTWVADKTYDNYIHVRLVRGGQ